MVLVVGNNGSTSGLPELEEDVDPVEENIGELSTEGQVLEEEGDEGGLHIGVLHPKLVVNKVLKKEKNEASKICKCFVDISQNILENS